MIKIKFACIRSISIESILDCEEHLFLARESPSTINRHLPPDSLHWISWNLMAHNQILKTINYNLKMLAEGTEGAGGRQQGESFSPKKKDRTKEARRTAERCFRWIDNGEGILEGGATFAPRYKEPRRGIKRWKKRSSVRVANME